MKLYLSARYSEMARMVQLARQLRDKGHEITSSWIDGKHREQGNESSAALLGYARECFEEIEASDAVISYSSVVPNCSRGGHHVELGIALALEKPIVLIGVPCNIFQHLAACTVETEASPEDLFAALRAIEDVPRTVCSMTLDNLLTAGTATHATLRRFALLRRSERGNDEASSSQTRRP